MARIRLFHSETYTDTIKMIRKRIKLFPDNIINDLNTIEFLCDYTNSAMWNENEPFSKLHQELMYALEPHEIVVYHNTRLPDKKSIQNYGLIFSDDRYTDMLRDTMENVGIEQSRINEVISAVIQEIGYRKFGEINTRKNEICFIYDMDYYREYEKFLATYGGEFMEFGLYSYAENRSLEKYKDILKIGNPYIVEFAIPFNCMELFCKMDVARFMMEEWIHIDVRKDKPEHKYDGRIEHEISVNKIIKIHEVEDSFPEIDAYLFTED